MSITYDAVGSGITVTDTLTFQVIVANNSNRLLVVGIGVEALSDPLGISPATVTYDGVAMTKIDEQVYRTAAGGGPNQISLWYLLAPNVGTANVVATWTVAPENGCNGGGISTHGVKQQAPEVNAKGNGSGTGATVNLTTITNNAWIFDLVNTNLGGSTFTAGAGQTERYDLGDFSQSAGSHEATVTAGVKTMSWTISASASWGIIAAAFEEFVAFVPVTDTFDAKVINSFDASGIDTDIYGMTFDGRSLWIIGNSDSVLHQVDRLGNIILEIDLSSIAASITAITFYKNSFWIFDESNGYLVHISPAGAVLQTIDVSGITADCKGLDFDGLFFWLSGSVGQNIYQINLDGKNVSNILTVYGKTHGVCFDGRNLVCLDNTKRTLEIYNKLGTQIGEFDFDPIDNSPRAICFDGKYYWISGNENDKIYQVIII